MSSIQVFKYGNSQIRTVLIDGEVWLVAKDVCDVLGLSNPTEALRALDDDEKMTVANSDGHSGMTLRDSEGHSGKRGGAQFFTVINEAGLYKLTFKSRKPEAKKFTRWVTHEVLPSIRSTGSYSVNQEAETHPAVRQEADNTPRLPAHSGVIKAAERITRKAFKCKDVEDFQELLALDAVFIKTFGVSALELAGLRVVKHDERADVDRWLTRFPEMEKTYGWMRRLAKVSFTLEHDYLNLNDE